MGALPGGSSGVCLGDNSRPPELQSVRNTYASLLRQYGESGSLEDGESISRKIILSDGLHKDVYLLNHVVQMYGDCGSVDGARAAFETMPSRNVFSWNIMIAAYAQNGHYKQALELFWTMNCRPSKVTFINVLTACAGLGELAALEAVHGKIDSWLVESEVVVGTALVNTYAKCGNLENATKVFERMRRKDSICFNAMIAAAAQFKQFKQALHLFQRMNLEGLRPTTATLLSFVAICNELDVARQIHRQALEIGLDNDVATMNSLVTMYANCGSTQDAWEVFVSTRNRDVISWNAMVAGFVQCAEFHEALKLSRVMDLEGVKFEQVTWMVVLSACNCEGALAEGKQLHARALTAGHHNNRMIQTALLSMYGRCGKVDLAAQVFSDLQDKEQPSYNAMISVYVQHGRAAEALKLFKQMESLQPPVMPNKVTYINLLEVCTVLESLEDGRRIHQSISVNQPELLTSDNAVGTLLVNMYGACGSLEDAEATFEKLADMGEVSVWNSMVGAYTQNEKPLEAVFLLKRMDVEGVKADEISFINLLSACASMEDLKSGCHIHERVSALGYELDLVTATALVSMYSKCGDLSKATEVFDGMQSRDTVSWNAMVAGFAQQGHLQQALAFVRDMDLEGMQPGETVLVTLTGSCQSFSQARAVHCFVTRSGVELGVPLMHMYTKCGSVEQARAVFDGMSRCSLLTWNTMFAAYAQNGHHLTEIACLLQDMVELGLRPDETTFLGVLNAFTHAGLLDRARSYFLDMVGEFYVEATVEHYGCMINLLGRTGRLRQAQELMSTMPYEPDAMVWTCLLSASTIHSHVGLAEESARSVVELDPRTSAPYVLFSNAIRYR